MTAPEASRPLYTGRQVVVLAPTSGKKNPAKTLESIAGFSNVARSKDFESQALEMAVANDADATVFDELGVAVVSADPDQRTALMAAAAEGSAILSVEPELIHYALTSLEYARGYHDGVSDLYGRLNGGAPAANSDEAAAPPVDNDECTWGLQATRVTTSPRTGEGSGSRCSTPASTSSIRTSRAERSPRSHSSPVSPHRTATGTARTASARLRLEARPPPPLRRRNRGRDLRGKGVGRRGLRLRHRHPGRHRLGAGQRLRGHLDVARR